MACANWPWLAWSDAGDFIRFVRPRKEKKARTKQLSETCHVCHSTLTYVSCAASLTYYTYADHDGVEHSARKHEGRHEHGRPPIRVLPEAHRAALDRQVRENPSLTAQQLRAGAGPTQVALGDINPILLSARKASTAILVWTGTIPTTVSFAGDVGSKRRLHYLSSQNKDWASPDVLWYPAQFVQHHRRRPNQFNEYEFRWLACKDGTLYISGDSMLPVLMLQTNFRSRKFLQEIREVQLAEEQIGQIRLPFYMKPDYPGHKNPVLSSIFDAALPTVAKILADWRNGNRVVEAFNDCISGSKGIDMHRKPVLFLEAFGLIPTPELEAVLFEPLSCLMKPHPELENLAEDECNRRVMGVGSALFQLLAIQHELGEPLNLNGDLISDLWEESVVPDRMDGMAALTAMFGSIALKANIPVDQQMLRFNRDHTIYDRDFRPPSFRRMLPSIRPPRMPITVVLPGKLKRAGSPLSKDEKPPKRQRKEKTHNDMEAEGVKKRQAKKAAGGKRRAKTPPVNAGHARSALVEACIQPMGANIDKPVFWPVRLPEGKARRFWESLGRL
ncbi:hypothetical protein DFH06DRAFT_1133850 [Mycena polygramma]|nr:hypothetical protein DFH06DRAFT_1133850 [Mycena polygramma]